MALLPPDDEEVTIETREATPANLLIKIESFSLLSKYGIRKYESREFPAGDYKWKLIIHSDGHESTENESDHISVYLSVAGTSSLPVDWEVNAIFSFFVYNQILDNYLCFRGIKARRFHAMNSEWGFSKLISKKSLTDPSNGYLVDDNCVFGAEVFVTKIQRVIECVSVQKVRDPYTRDWRISDFLEEDVQNTEVFPAGGLRWKIKIYPNGNGSEKGRSVSIIMECVDSKSFAPHEKVKADFCMTIKSPNYPYYTIRSVNFSQWFSSSQPDWEILDFMPIADRRNGCTLETKISVQVVALDKPESKYSILKIEN